MARPSYEFGFGEVTKINSLNLDGVYFIPVTARDRSTQQIEFWNVYVGAGLGIHLSQRGFEEAGAGDRFRRLGLQHRT